MSSRNFKSTKSRENNNNNDNNDDNNMHFCMLKKKNYMFMLY